MAIFSKKYSLIIYEDYDTTLAMFRDSLDDMSKKGYSLSGNTIIHNSDHNSKYFSGEYKGDHFVVRQTENGTDDFYYRLLPRHEIRFEDQGDNTKVSVRSSAKYLLILFVIFVIAAIFVFSVALSGYKNFMLFAFIPAVLAVVVCLISSHLINDTMYTLKYILIDRK